MVFGLLLAMLGLAAQDRQDRLTSAAAAAAATWSTIPVRVGTPTYFADGQVRGATATFTATGHPQTVYVTSGRTLCDSRSASTEPPADAGYGWRLQVHRLDLIRYVVRRGGALTSTIVEMQVTWQRMWERGQPVADGLKGTAKITLRPDDSILLDHLPAAGQAPGCGALGMGLEIGVPKPSTAVIYETDVWLVEQAPGAQEKRQHQAMRMQESNKTQFFFTDIAVPLASMPAYTSEAMRAKIQAMVTVNGRPVTSTLSVSGSVSVSARQNGKIHVRLEITRGELDNVTQRRGSGGTTYEFDADEGQTISFELPESSSVPSSVLKLQLVIRAKLLGR